MSGGGASAGVKAGQTVVGSGRLGLGWDADGGSGVITDGGGGGGDGDSDALNLWEDTVANVILGTEPNATLASSPVLELRHLIMSILGEHGGRLEREIDPFLNDIPIGVFLSSQLSLSAVAFIPLPIRCRGVPQYK